MPSNGSPSSGYNLKVQLKTMMATLGLVLWSVLNLDSVVELINFFGWGNFCRCADDKPFVPTYQVSKERAKSLGINFTSLEDSIRETVDSLKEKNFI